MTFGGKILQILGISQVKIVHLNARDNIRSNKFKTEIKKGQRVQCNRVTAQKGFYLALTCCTQDDKKDLEFAGKLSLYQYVVLNSFLSTKCALWVW